MRVLMPLLMTITIFTDSEKIVLVEQKAEIRDVLIEAIIEVESGNDTLAYNSKEDAVGCLQIRPIMVREVNRLLGKDSFTLYDRWSKVKSIQMFNVLRSHLKGASDEEIARTWNGGYNGKNKPQTLVYWKKVKQYTLNNRNL